MRVCTLRMSTNGGSTTTSTSDRRFSGRLNASFWVSAIASRWLRFIFQLPAISGRRASAISALQRLDAGQLLAFEVLEGSATAGRDVPERRLVETELGDRQAGGQGDLAGGEQLAPVAELALLRQRVTAPVALRLEEREAHAAADEQPVHLRQQRLDHGQLAGALRPAEHDQVRAGRVA